MKVAVVGATGLVGTKMLEVLAGRNFPVTELIPVASPRSAGGTIWFRDEPYPILTAARALEKKPDLALFSAGGSVSLEWTPVFTALGCRVIDNSSAWRMHESVPLIVPEVNGHILRPDHLLIANPNCSTIQMVVVLAPLAQTYGIRRVVVSTYQSVTGTGVKAVEQLMKERRGEAVDDMAYPYQIDLNVLPQVDVFTEDGYTREEHKMMNETRKIMNLPDLAITATTVRIPVMGGHSESVNVELEKAFSLPEITTLLGGSPGIVLQNDHLQLEYPMPLTAHNRDEVFVGRIRRDVSIPNGLNLWIVADNLRKGAATNAVQIAELFL